MAHTSVLPRTKNVTGTNCSGADGGSNRTYTVPDTTILSSGLDIVINGTTLMEGSGNDFTISSNVITFLNAVDDSDIIRITYWITLALSSEASLSTSTSLKYATPIMFADILGVKETIPSWAVEGSPTNEEVGTGTGSQTIFYLDHQNVLADSYILYYGASAATTTELEETTHYVMTEDTGKIVLTAAGVTILSTNKIYATYSYIDNGMNNSYFVTVLSRAEKEVDKSLNSTFTDGTATNPDYPVETEYQASEGLYKDRFIVKKKPIKDVESALDGDVTSSQTTIDVTAGDGNGFPESGYIIVESEVMSYTGVTTDQLTGVTRGVLGTTATTHSDGDAIHSTILFVSDTYEGTAVSWDVQPWDTYMHATEEGLFYRYLDADPDPLLRYGIANRIKIIYYYGYDVVPGDITRLTLLFAKRMLIQDNVGSSMIKGRNEFRPEMFAVDGEEMKRIIGSYIVVPMGNT